MSVSFKLVRADSVLADYRWAGAHRLRVTCTDAVGIDEHVFLFRRDPLNPYTRTMSDKYLGVASPVEMADYPAGEPDDITGFPFFRQSSFEIDLPAAILAETIWEATQSQCAVLIRAVKALALLRTTATAQIGDAPGSESFSLSGSA